CCRRHHWGQQASRRHAVHKLQPVRDILRNPQMFHQRLDREVERARDHHLPQSQLPRLVDELVSARKHRGLDHVFKQLLREIPQPVLRLPLVALEIQVVENFSAILVRHREDWKAQKRGRALFEAGHQALLATRVEREGMHEVCAYQSSLKIVECSPRQALLQRFLQYCGRPSARIGSHYTALRRIWITGSKSITNCITTLDNQRGFDDKSEEKP